MSDEQADELLPTDQAGVRQLALQRVKKRRDFHSHLFVYVIVNAMVWAVWALVGRSDGGTPWPILLTLAWGVGLIFNAWDVYGRRPITEDDVRAEMRRIQHQR